MFSSKSASLIAVLSLALFAGGCAAEADESTASSNDAVTAASITLRGGTFKLYDEPSAKPEASCDIHTKLVLSNKKGTQAHATLTDEVSGVCRIFIEPNVREYDLELEMNRCGSRTLVGSAMVKGELHHLSIVDHRERMCDDLQEAVIVVDEVDAKGRLTKRYTEN